jgi:nitric oxide reductase NorE protein
MSTSTISPPLAEQAAKPKPHTPGEAGVWVFIMGDLAIFATLFATYLFYRGRDPQLFTSGQQTLNQGYGLANTLLLLTSSLLVVAGVRALRELRPTVAPWMFLGAIACGLGFALIKILEYGEKLSQSITPATNDFYTFYFVLTGLHFFHLVLGLGVLAFMVRAARASKRTHRRFALIEGGACFWHMVDALWIVLFPLLYLVK